MLGVSKTFWAHAAAPPPPLPRPWQRLCTGCTVSDPDHHRAVHPLLSSLVPALERDQVSRTAALPLSLSPLPGNPGMTQGSFHAGEGY